MNSQVNLNNLTTSEAAFAGGILGTFIIGAIVYAIFLIIAYWRIFEKAGVKGWKSLIPIYNIYCAYKIAGFSPWWILWQILANCAFNIAVVSAANGATINWEEALPDYVWSNGWVIATAIITCLIGLYVTIVFSYRLAKVFKKGVGFTIGLILLPSIFTLILGFGSAKYDKKALKA